MLRRFADQAGERCGRTMRRRLCDNKPIVPERRRGARNDEVVDPSCSPISLIRSRGPRCRCRGNTGGVLTLGTEIVNVKDGSIAALPGASPGASTAAPISLQVLEKVFARKVATPEWQAEIRRIVPSYGTKLNDDPERVAQAWTYTAAELQLPTPPQTDRSVLKPVPTRGTVLSSSATPVKEPVHDPAP
jgi:hypothetical protein